MTTRNATITSKNQITIPADMVRELNLGNSRSVTITTKKDSLVLKPQPNVETVMSPIWQEMHAHLKTPKKLTDKDIHEEVQRTYAAMDAKEHRW
jgi:bifunctional DNA-binding transcriptional regulator/antitoxin component of YhaV-PrlF toxin-antitoxin module